MEPSCPLITSHPSAPSDVVMASASQSAPPSLPSSTRSISTSPYQQTQNVDVTATAPQRMQLTPSQSELCRYPIGCPVWVSDHGSSEFTFRQGVVNSVLMDFATKAIVYEVLLSSVGLMGAPSDKYGEVAWYHEGGLSFAPLTPVYVASDGDRRECGVVLLRKKCDGYVLYTVQLDGSYQENVDAEKVSYRSGRFAVSPSPNNSVAAPLSSVPVQMPLIGYQGYGYGSP